MELLVSEKYFGNTSVIQENVQFFFVLICTHTTLQFFLLQISRHEEHASQLIGTSWNAFVPYWGHPLEWKHRAGHSFPLRAVLTNSNSTFACYVTSNSFDWRPRIPFIAWSRGRANTETCCRMGPGSLRPSIPSACVLDVRNDVKSEWENVCVACFLLTFQPPGSPGTHFNFRYFVLKLSFRSCN
jgi:hypothetical protein